MGAIRLKFKLYRTVRSSEMVDGSECFAVDREIEQRMSEVEMRI